MQNSLFFSFLDMDLSEQLSLFTTGNVAAISRGRYDERADSPTLFISLWIRRVSRMHGESRVAVTVVEALKTKNRQPLKATRRCRIHHLHGLSIDLFMF